jgi:hypothetical protein
MTMWGLEFELTQMGVNTSCKPCRYPQKKEQGFLPKRQYVGTYPSDRSLVHPLRQLFRALLSLTVAVHQVGRGIARQKRELEELFHHVDHSFHVASADAQGRVLGGHAGYGCSVRTTAEILVALLPTWYFAREPDALTGWSELTITRLNPG